jgi:hypothetical protein
MTQGTDCAPFGALVEGYVALLGKAQDVLGDHLKPEKHVSGEAALAELIELLNGPEWQALEGRRAQLCGRSKGADHR